MCPLSLNLIIIFIICLDSNLIDSLFHKVFLLSTLLFVTGTWLVNSSLSALVVLFRIRPVEASDFVILRLHVLLLVVYLL
jgi:hypothetical protein